MVPGVSVAVAPVLQVDAEAVVTAVGQYVKLLVAQPVFPPGLPKATAVLQPTTVKTHGAIAPPLKHRPPATWCAHKMSRATFRFLHFVMDTITIMEAFVCDRFESCFSSSLIHSQDKDLDPPRYQYCTV